MKYRITLASFLFVMLVSTQTFAASGWVEEFLKRYQPGDDSTGSPRDPIPFAAPSPEAGAAQSIPLSEIPVTVSDIVNLTLDRNLNIAADRFTPRSSYLQALVFWQALLPSLSFSFNTGRNTSASTSQTQTTAGSLSQLTHNFSTTLAQSLASGTSAAVTFSMNRLSSTSNLTTFNPSYTGRITYTVGQHLLQNRGRIINMRQIEEGLNSQKISEAGFEIQITALIAQANKAYWDMVFAGQDTEVKQRALEQALRELDEDRTRVELGTLAPVDVVQTNQSVSSRRLLLVTSQFTMTQTEDQVKKLIAGQSSPAMFLSRLKALDLPVRNASVPSLEEAVKTAWENRPEIRQAMLDRQNKDIEVTYSKNQRKPALDVTASYTQNGIGGTQQLRGSGLGGAVSQSIPGGLGNSLSQLFGYQFNGYSAGVSLVMPLNRKSVDASYDNAVNQRELSDANLEATKAQIALDVRNALMQIELYRAQTENAQNTLDLARQTLTAEQTKLDLGTSTLRFVLEDQDTVAADESAVLQAIVNMNKSLVDLDQAMGLTLSRNNIQLDRVLDGVSGAK